MASSAVGPEEAVGIILANWPKYKRSFPWRDTRDAWATLLAEVLLIQTDAAKVAQVYEALLSAAPNP